MSNSMFKVRAGHILLLYLGSTQKAHEAIKSQWNFILCDTSTFTKQIQNSQLSNSYKLQIKSVNWNQMLFGLSVFKIKTHLQICFSEKSIQDKIQTDMNIKHQTLPFNITNRSFVEVSNGCI